MGRSVNVTRKLHILRLYCVTALCVLFPDPRFNAQDIPSFEQILSRNVSLREDVVRSHPRLFFSAADIETLRAKAKGEGRDLWAATLKDIQALRRPAPDPDDEDLYKSGLDNRKPGSIAQYGFAFQIAQTSLAYVIEQDERYLKAAKEWTLVACEMPLWGYTYNKPNVDLPPAHLLYSVAFAYDVLHDKLTPAEKETIRNKLVTQGRLMYEYFKYKPGKRYTYTQNHTWIPMAGLAIAAYAIMDEVPEAAEWARLSRAVFDRTMVAFGTDGYFYESFHYFGFAFRWMIRYFDAHLAATGENLYAAMQPKFVGMKYFAMHSVLPDGENVFDFADVGDGSLNRNGTSARESIYSEYDILYRFASVYKDPQAQAIGDYLRHQTKLDTREPMWAFLSFDPAVKAVALADIPLQYHFKDNDTVFWRSAWTKYATAFAFRCSPPEGHHAARLNSKIKDWRQNTGHAHPDANSFIIWANGRYLTGDTGYLGIKKTDAHNTILVNGRGQENDGVYEMFKEVPNERLDRIRLAEVDAGSGYLYARGEAASSYYPDLGISKFDRHFIYVEPGYFVIWDELETSKPSLFTFLLNADKEIVGKDPKLEFINGDARLLIDRLDPIKASVKIIDQEIQARGLPGSVDKGDSEIRGRQLRVTSTTAATSGGFLNVLVPAKAGVSTVAEVSKIPGGLSVTLANGRKDTICLGGPCGSERTSPGRVMIRRGHEKPALVFQRTSGSTAKLFRSE